MTIITRLMIFPLVCASLAGAAPLKSANSVQAYWVFFEDKGLSDAELQTALQQVRSNLNAHARWRRAKVLPALVDEYDLPVASDYIEAVVHCGAKQRFISRWLNAVSIEANSDILKNIQSLPFVSKIQPVAKYFPCHRNLTINDERLEERNPSHLDDFIYGPSYEQLEQCNVPAMHARGLTGEGIRLCLLDTGFYLEHEVFDSAHVIATWDFINIDSIVWNEQGQDTSNQHEHGTITLSVAAGRRDSALYGPAFGADLICGKTEDVRSETPVEEDYYVAGLEWAEDLGADVVSSSLGYIAWYTFEDMDGNTAVTTIAVDIAVSRGIVVCTAAGNERDDPWEHIISPADADSVIAVGAVDSYGIISDFSSPGPTYDGRTKPEVCAQGVATYAAVPWFGTDGYWTVSGTSLSTPIVAGICVLLLEAHPDWTPMQLREALLMTACQASSPDNDYGWGIPDGVAALDYISASPLFEDFTPQKRILISAYPNPVNSVATWTIEIPQSEIGSFTITDILGRTVAHISQKQWTAGHYSVPFQTTYLSSGIYFGRFDGIRSQAVGKVVLIK